MSYLEQVLNTYEKSYVEHYPTWKELLVQTNEQLTLYIEELSLSDIVEVEPFAYNEFCSLFHKELKKYLNKYNEIEHDQILDIVDYLLKKKIIDSLIVSSN